MALVSLGIMMTRIAGWVGPVVPLVLLTARMLPRAKLTSPHGPHHGLDVSRGPPGRAGRRRARAPGGGPAAGRARRAVRPLQPAPARPDRAHPRQPRRGRGGAAGRLPPGLEPRRPLRPLALLGLHRCSSPVAAPSTACAAAASPSGRWRPCSRKTPAAAMHPPRRRRTY